MKRMIIVLTGLAGGLLLGGEVAAWGSANRFGGSTEHVAGVGTEHTNAWGGSSEHAFGGGSEHTNVYGGSTAGRYGEGAEHTNMYGGTTAARYGDGAYHTTPYGATAYRPPAPYYPYHPPAAVPYYPATGCYGCAAAAGAVVGMAAGAAVASANTAAATSSAYSSGYAAGSATTAAAYAAPPPVYAMGVSYATLPPGATAVQKYGTTYFLVGNTWFLPAYGANGVYYRVVAAP
jgi:hypothetical protein